MTQETKPETKRSKSSREIETELGETRAALSEDVKALSDKVSPAHLKQQAKQAVDDVKDAALEKAAEIKDAAREATDVAIEKAVEVKDVAVEKAQQAATAVSETVEEVSDQAVRAGRVAWGFAVDNAVPLGLIGLGAGWLIAKRRRELRVPQTDLADYPADNAGYYVGEPTGGDRRSARRPTNHAAARGKRSAEKLGTAQARIEDGAHALYEKAGQSIERTEHGLMDGAHRTRDLVQENWVRARDASRDFAERNPLAVTLGALVTGVGIGLLLPASTRENQLLGPARQKLNRAWNDARGAVRDVGSLAQETAKDAFGALEGTTH